MILCAAIILNHAHGLNAVKCGAIRVHGRTVYCRNAPVVKLSIEVFNGIAHKGFEEQEIIIVGATDRVGNKYPDIKLDWITGECWFRYNNLWIKQRR